MSRNDQNETPQPPPIVQRVCEAPPLVRSSPSELAAIHEQRWMRCAALKLAADVASYFDLDIEAVWDCLGDMPRDALPLLRSAAGQKIMADFAVDELAPEHPLRRTFKPDIVFQ